ncbi:LysR family transcriptional regulator [Burkholderia cepacia]|uniref:LysR family transcriptional regulator n=1 Tax=Burkholderia cepacia TaxID=292 RepID=UPI002AB6C95B|nr:LysR family transcriptional regulator [Burkholderia cepacia]
MPVVKIHLEGQVSDFDLRLLRIFKAVVEAGGFAAAEVELNISRSAISTAISDLETRLGLTLCRRGRAGFSVTDAGARVYEKMLELFGSIDAFRSQINRIHTSLRGELRIGITDNLISMQRMKIVGSLKTLKEAAPDVVINIRMMPPNEIEKAVLSNELDVGMIPQWRKTPGLAYEPIYEEESGLYCGEDHVLFKMNDAELNVDPERILSHDIVVPAYAQPARIEQLYRDTRASATVSDREGVAFLIMTGCFVGILPTHYAHQWVVAGTMRRLLPDEFNFVSEYMAVSRSTSTGDQILSTYLRALRAAP